jgi:hypothetical protein
MAMFTVKAEVIRTCTLLVHFEAPDMESAEQMMDEMKDSAMDDIFEELSTCSAVDETYFEMNLTSDVAKAEKSITKNDIECEVKEFCDQWIEDNQE